MSDELLGLYNRELAYLRDLGAEFAKDNPKIAGRLGIGADEVKDPHVSRMVEAFAYLNARTRSKLEDDFPEIAESMLDVLYPHFQRPIPSMTVVQLGLDNAQVDQLNGFQVARDSSIETEAIDGEPCRFRTCYSTTCWPMRTADISLKSHPFIAPASRFNADAESVLRIQLDTFQESLNFDKLNIEELRFFIKEQAPYKFDLYEMIMSSAIGVVVAANEKSTDFVELPAQCIEPVGFDRDQGMWDYPSRSFLGYRLLSEFFAFPDKFLFFDLALKNSLRSIASSHAEIFIYFDKTSSDLERRVDKETLPIGCTPIVNLFEQEAEPVRLSHEQHEYRIEPDSRRPLANEIYSINQVTAVSRNNEEATYHPFYSFKHATEARKNRRYWHASRRKNPSGGSINDFGTEMYISVVDLDFQPSAEESWSLHTDLTCLNRDLPGRLPFGGDQPRMHLNGVASISKVRCLLPPTETRRPVMQHGARWRLISHLSINHLSLVDSGDGAHALREILGLYDYIMSDVTKAYLDGLLSVKGERTTARMQSEHGTTVGRGTKITLEFDRSNFTGGGLFLMASVLERFLALYCTINSFTQTVATVKNEGELHRWVPRAGEHVLV